MKEIIMHIVSLQNGIKSIPLMLAVMEKVNPQRFSLEIYKRDLQTLIDSGEVREFEYTEPGMEYRVKSIYFSGVTLFLGDYHNVVGKTIVDGTCKRNLPIP